MRGPLGKPGGSFFLRELVMVYDYDRRSKVAVIRKEKGQYCVRSPNNPDWDGGCYDTEEEAKKRLQQVEFFKHNKA